MPAKNGVRRRIVSFHYLAHAFEDYLRMVSIRSDNFQGGLRQTGESCQRTKKASSGTDAPLWWGISRGV
jgi:hypothetical protein